MAAPLFFYCSQCGAANTFRAPFCFACNEPLDQEASLSSAQLPLPALPVPVAPPLAVPLGPGSLLHERYQLVREIGRGGFGVVYLAEDCQRNHQQVAVKQINIGQLSARESIDATDSYNREVTLLSRLKHRRLPRIYDHFTDPEHWYLVMDYIEGQTLEAALQGMPGQALPVKKAITIGIQVCDVLNYLHTQDPPIIFRDVKPANIMQTPSGQVYLIDFGIARHFVPGCSRDTGPLGSPGYAAPEQYGKTQTTIHTDIYGLGATLQTLVTGKDPLELQTGETSPSPVPRLDKQLHLLLGQMLEKESSKRPQHIREVRARLVVQEGGGSRSSRRALWGFLLGIAPYVLFVALAPFASFSFFFYLLVALYCVWPFLFGSQLIVAAAMLFQPGKRLVGLGILTGLALFVLALFLRQEPLSGLLSWPSLGD